MLTIKGFDITPDQGNKLLKIVMDWGLQYRKDYVFGTTQAELSFLTGCSHYEDVKNYLNSNGIKFEEK